jgi:hypothetical protein
MTSTADIGAHASVSKAYWAPGAAGAADHSMAPTARTSTGAQQPPGAVTATHQHHVQIDKNVCWAANPTYAATRV